MVINTMEPATNKAGGGGGGGGVSVQAIVGVEEDSHHHNNITIKRYSDADASVHTKETVELSESPSQEDVHAVVAATTAATAPTSKDYYLQGSQELATESALTLDRLQARQKLTKNCERLVLVLVGLPARGKSFLGRKLTGFLNWHGVHCKVFNVGKYRRQVEGEESSKADFFDAKNTKAAALREQAAAMALQDMLQWLDNEELHTQHSMDSFVESTSSDDDDNNDKDDDACAAFHKQKMNPELYKSERYTRHDVLNLQEIGSIGCSSKKTEGSPQHAILKKQQLTQKLLRHERIAIFDATNSTHKRREWILEMCTSPEHRPDKPTGCVFIESICDDTELLMENFKDKISNSPDYAGVPLEDAMADLTKRVQKYEDQYETITDDELSYIKIFNLSTKMLVNHIYGRMSKIIMPAMMAWNIGTRPIFLCRPGQTLQNITTDGEDYVAKVDRVDETDYLEMSRKSQVKFLRGYHLGHAGKEFSKQLLEFCRQEGIRFHQKRESIMDLKNTGTSKTGLRKSPEFEADVDAAAATTSKNGGAFPLQIYTSTMPRATETVLWDVPFPLEADELPNLNPLDKGDFAGLEGEEIHRLNPRFYEQLTRDPFHTRFPGGESYCDLIKRLDTVIVDLEQQVTPTLVVSHVSVLQMLMAYFRNSPVEECMDIDIPLHTVIKFTPARGGGWSESIHPLVPPEAAAVAEPQPRMVSPPVPPTKETTIKFHDHHHQQQQPQQPTKQKKPNLWRKIFGNEYQHHTHHDQQQQQQQQQEHNNVVAGSPSSVLDERTHRGMRR